MRSKRHVNLPRPPKPARVPARLSKKLKTNELIGRLSATPSGYGFVTLEKAGEGDIFIPARYMENAMDGDTVEVALIAEHDLSPQFAGKGRTGMIAKVLTRNRKRLVGEFLPGGKVLPMTKKIPQIVTVSGGANGATPGDWVEVLLHPAENESGLRCAVQTILGEVGTIATDLDAVVAEYGLPDPYTDAEEIAAEKLEPLAVEREDVSSVFCVTIDPFDAKDHDDAMSLSSGEEPGTVILGVHIADVASFIQPGTRWDREAKRRSFTSYLPGRTLPMLPRKLTQKMSLLPGEKSPAHSVYLTYRLETGELLSVRRVHSWVSITHSLNYDEVQQFMDGSIPAGWDNMTCCEIRKMVDLTRIMRKKRMAEEKFLHLAVPELRVVVDEAKQRITALENRVQREAEEVVEECMLAANAAVATELYMNHVPGIFRVHDEPNPDKLDQFIAQMWESFGISVGDISTREGCNAFLESLPDDENRSSVMSGFLRAMARAVYTPECLPHYGLGKEKYLHFTSPIRRYPDLLVHRQLLAVSGYGKIMSNNVMGVLAAECTEKEEIVDEAYYAANDRMKLHYLWQVAHEENKEVWDAVVNRVNANGVMIEIHALGLHGIIEHDALLQREKGRSRKSGKRGDTIRLSPGEHLKVRPARIDFVKGTAYFVPDV